MSPVPSIVFSGVGKTFVTDAGDDVVALEKVDLAIKKGEFVAILGPTGCGKSTLLNLAAGLEVPTVGSVDRAPELKPGRNMPCVFQNYTLFPWRDLSSNVSFALDMRGVKRGERVARTAQLLRKVGLEPFRHVYPHELSGGMRQRAAIAQALAADPEVLFMDEPFGALDDVTRSALQTMIVALWRETGMTVFFVTHNIEEALLVAERVIVFSAHPGRPILDLPVALEWPRDTTHEDYFTRYMRVRRALNAGGKTVSG